MSSKANLSDAEIDILLDILRNHEYLYVQFAVKRLGYSHQAREKRLVQVHRAREALQRVIEGGR